MESLPKEIVFMIVDYLKNPIPICMLASTCRVYHSYFHNNSLIVKYREFFDNNDWYTALEDASQIEQDLDLVKFVLRKENDLNFTMESAACVGNTEIINYCIQNGADNWSEVFNCAFEYGNIDLIKFFRHKVDKDIDDRFEEHIATEMKADIDAYYKDKY